jgi:hypothetical protein
MLTAMIAVKRGELEAQVTNHRCKISDWFAKSLRDMVARDGVEPPTPAFPEFTQIMFVTT